MEKIVSPDIPLSSENADLFTQGLSIFSTDLDLKQRTTD